MTTPSIDIILPVWNSPVEIRSCLVSLLPSLEAGAKLILINNGCDRETEKLLEEFSDHLANQAIYMTLGRNIGFVPALNHGLKRSDADWAVILRTSTTLHSPCQKWLEAAVSNSSAGIITPSFPLLHNPMPKLDNKGFRTIETSEISFDLAALSREMREKTGLFDETLDGSRWCLKDYRCRANANGFMTYLATGMTVKAGSTIFLGSEERRRIQEKQSEASYHERWGRPKKCAIYLPPSTENEKLLQLSDTTLKAARLGHTIELFLHRKQYQEASVKGFHRLHTSISMHKLPLLAPLRRLSQQISRLKTETPELLIIKGMDDSLFPGHAHALPAATLDRLTGQTRED